MTPRSCRAALAVAALLFAFAVAGSAQRRDAFVQSRNHPAIGYGTTPPDDAVARLNQRLQDGKAKLAFNEENGYLASLLEALEIPVESQSLVFSQTSFQAPLINVKNPRAIYFNDTVAVGWVRGADLLEVAAQDPRAGVIFYRVDQKPAEMPVLQRDDDCLACHLSWDTLGVPGLMVQSVHPLLDDKSYVIGFTTNHASPFAERWGGWYVTGTHGKLRHIGNVPVMPADQGKLKLADPREIRSVDGLFDLKGYLTPYSDATALMVYDHQTFITNQITRLSWEARLADSSPSADATARVQEAASDLSDYMLFIDEVPLLRPIDGASGFAARFSAQGPVDSQGRSLHQLDLQKRLLRYPCSYMIYSPGFEGMPKTAKDAVYARLSAILSGKETRNRYTARLTAADREAILQILRETKHDLPPSFGA